MRHGVWANEKLVERCRALADEQLELTVPGTYGTIRSTLAHIVASEEGYLVRLSGSLLHEPPVREQDLATLDGIAAHIAHVTRAVERLFAKGSLDPDRVIADTPLITARRSIRSSVPTVSRRSTCRCGRTPWSSARAARPRRTDEHATDASSDATRRVGDREAARAVPLAHD